MIKGKRIEIQTMIYKTLQRKLKIEQYETHYKNRGAFRYPDRVSRFLYVTHYNTRARGVSRCCIMWEEFAIGDVWVPEFPTRSIEVS
jgi:hypothetical protein